MTTLQLWYEYAKKEHLLLTPGHLFKLARPDFEVSESQAPGTKWDNDYVAIKFEDIEEWKDFQETNVNNAMGRIIEEPIDHPDWFLLDRFETWDSKTRIHEEKDIDNWFLDGATATLNHALNGTRDKLLANTHNEHARKLKFPYVKDASKVMLPQHAATDSKRHQKRPNFPVYLPAKSMPRLTPFRDVIYVLGDSARTNTLDPKNFYRNRRSFNDHGKNHLGKMAMYAKGSGTCLAFTMTHIGVTVFRFFIVDGTSRLGVQHRTFPWCPEEGGSDKENLMSGIKAIYVLAVMSLFPEARTIRERSQLCSVADWPRMR